MLGDHGMRKDGSWRGGGDERCDNLEGYGA